MKKLSLLAAALIIAGSAYAQKTITPDDCSPGFDRHLGSVLSEIALRFGVEIDYSTIDKNATVVNGNFNIKPWSLEESLDAVLDGKTGYGWEKQDNVYVVTRPDYHQVSPEEGQKKLDWLSSLYSDRTTWEARTDSLRTALKEAFCMTGVPEHFDGKVYLGAKRTYKDYYVQNIGIEILPGVWATGSMYHPVKYKKGKCPVILNPHGHYEDGRYTDLIQIRCAMQAKLGCVSIAYDMFAWGMQPMFDRSWHHTTLAQPMQVLSGERFLDYLCALPEADLTRVGVTGSSGGGSQTMFITAIDDRVTLSMPVVMPSSYFNGGCECESGTGLHLLCGGTSNVEIAAMCAPRPMLIVSDGADWTAHTPQIEMPYVERIYGFYGAKDKVANVHLPQEVHDYGPSKRAATYDFLAAQWGIDVSKFRKEDGSYDESGAVVEDYDLLKVWGPNGENWPEGAVKDAGEIVEMLARYRLAAHLGLCTSLDNAVKVRDNGGSYVETTVSGFLIPEEPFEKFKKNLDKARACELPVIRANGFFPSDLRLTGPEADIDRAVKYSKVAFERARMMGIDVVVLGSSGSRSIPEGFSRDVAREQFVTLLRRIAPYAEKNGIILVIEPLRPDETNFINTVREGASIAREVGHPNICVLADIYHMLQSGEDPGAIIEAGSTLRHCHIAENARRTPPGVDGDDFSAYFDALAKIDYKGYMSIECGWDDMDTQLPVAMNVLKTQILKPITDNK